MSIESKFPFEAHVVLFEPEIPQNTGNIARTCAALGCPLHLIEPLGFSLEDKYVKRAGMDYWQQVTVHRYTGLDQFFQLNEDGQFYLLSKKVNRFYHEAKFEGKAFLMFGRESLGLPEELIKKHFHRCFRIPMLPTARSLNLSNAVAITLYEAYRQNGFSEMLTTVPGQGAILG